jgi:hypothetical protein
MARPINDEGAPAIWIYTDKPQDFLVKLAFAGEGFLTQSTPDYNDGWRIHVDPARPFYKYSLLYGDKTAAAFLDYDGFRGGDFQKQHGWCIKQEDLLGWQRTHLKEIGFTDSEIDDVNFTYGRRLLERRYKAPFFAVYPQTTEIVNTSVALDVTPRPTTVYRLWLYFVPVDAVPPGLQTPRVPKVVRTGVTVVELAYLTDREIPTRKNRLVASRAGSEVHERHG